MKMLKRTASALMVLSVVLSSMVLTAKADDVPKTVAHWKLQNDPAYVSGNIMEDDLTFTDISGNGNDLVTAYVGKGDDLYIFEWGDGCTIEGAASSSALTFNNTKDNAASVDTYSSEQTSWTGGYTSGKYLETVENAPINSMDFAGGFTVEVIFKISPELNNDYNRYCGIFSRQGVNESANEPPFSMALTEIGGGTTLADGSIGLQYVKLSPDGAKTNLETQNGMIMSDEWIHFMVTSDGDGLTEIYVNGEPVEMIAESAPGIMVTDSSYRWEVGVGRKSGTGHAGVDTMNEDYPEGLIRRLFCGTISEIRVMDGYIPDTSLSLLSGTGTSETTAETPAETPTETPAAVTIPHIDYDVSVKVASNGGFDTAADATVGTIIPSSEYTFVEGTSSFDGEGPEQLWDGDTATKFCTNYYPTISIAKLSSPATVSGFVMATANDNAENPGRNAQEWGLFVSADGENWTQIAYGDASFFEDANFKYYGAETEPVDGVQYVKFQSEGGTSGVFQMSEIQLCTPAEAETVPAVSETPTATAAPTAPQTFDLTVAGIVCAVVSLAGYAVSKKR